jgi:hypothetical protein
MQKHGQYLKDAILMPKSLINSMIEVFWSKRGFGSLTSNKDYESIAGTIERTKDPRELITLAFHILMSNCSNSSRHNFGKFQVSLFRILGSKEIPSSLLAASGGTACGIAFSNTVATFVARHRQPGLIASAVREV